MNPRPRSPKHVLWLALFVPVAVLSFGSLSPCRSTVPFAPIPGWAVVSGEQIAEARRLGVAVAYEEPRAGLRLVLIPGTAQRPAFYLSMTETTNTQYRRFRPNHVGAFHADEQPADCAAHADVLAFCAWMSEGMLGGSYRLPTEAEWEFACRAGTTTLFSFGDVLTTEQANINAGGRPVAPSRRCRTTPVGSYPPNAWGLFDMHGNLREWCSGRSGPHHVATRGGNWRRSAAQARSDYRDETERASAHADPDIGFRIARSIQPGTGH